MRIIQTVADLRTLLPGMQRPVLVPTMGGLHQGHLSLIRLARAQSRPIVASVFVNRLQFGPGEDFKLYPRSLASDAKLLESAGCDVLFAPSEKEIYPNRQELLVAPPKALADILEGAFRPGFFAGVCTAVLKLFHIVQPHAAVFGRKDFQQLLVVRSMVSQLALPIEVTAAETIREPDGLAMSSRNSYLNALARLKAPQLHNALQHVCYAIEAGRRDWKKLESNAMASLKAQGWTADYVAIRRQDNLQKPSIDVPLVVLGAARLGRTRLIDNLELKRIEGTRRKPR
jgi:pantoate--beta-alanine ligase